MCCNMVPPGTDFFPIEPDHGITNLDTQVFGECGPCLSILGMVAEIDTQNPPPEGSPKLPAIHCPSFKVTLLPKPIGHQYAGPPNKPSHS